MVFRLNRCAKQQLILAKRLKQQRKHINSLSLPKSFQKKTTKIWVRYIVKPRYVPPQSCTNTQFLFWKNYNKLRVFFRKNTLTICSSYARCLASNNERFFVWYSSIRIPHSRIISAKYKEKKNNNNIKLALKS